MNLEEWLSEHDVKEMVLKNYKNYIFYYKEEEPEDYNEVFGDKKEKDIKIIFHSVAYVINTWQNYDTNDGTYKYISVKIRLEYNDDEFAEYEVIYGLDGEYHDDYFREI
ncbi:hypothetical protein BJV85_000537 [Clostridium acetobutylicum]|uniref:Uncharacterized protein n=1 Tax=Clostridium acetobutylicum (strain ATCC 824 / DSM 792 / JCM 1419 / IAM 19013 / LMG 5710 / NBRC 13948 / NRRL B-527 / VKM B-1787 / 2291 / W) TaxID=272562 RepID=Q97DV4_CLOAB|nr:MULTISPECIES: hypothetical protein [Clostridium]AAK81298.1 Hypothetical protein CA_C3366 [Clostridium acetobutylicum ATCC 824]ADZ22406.1 Conserved hypothetical protein [Clostridium acetobutylicum EA 2018]AEI32800.1 hypothetical protein SMB_G3403 [Clostridium acetobutylicum DSM 1731]AWV81036.1 hypothetical protein DK921_13175 [Clostridium acetobutylicum]MBC2395550.1 hypothetical protein [Clostridium acetobutylicum]